MEFKRINFFKGFFTEAEDWQKGQAYHIEKRKLHNSTLHKPGIVEGHLEGLSVIADSSGTTLRVGAGCAVDGEGRELYLSSGIDISIVPQEYNPPATVYIALRYQEKPIDRRQNMANPEYSGYAFIKENPDVFITKEEPGNESVIELARIRLAEKSQAVRNAKNPSNPGEDEIDRRFIRIACAVFSGLRLKDIGEIVQEGEIRVSASPDPSPSEEDTNVLIEKIGGENLHRFYLANAYPTGKARITWRIEACNENASIEYRIFFKNLGDNAVNVAYRVYRMD